jgi:hypothetical protein
MQAAVAVYAEANIDYSIVSVGVSAASPLGARTAWGAGFSVLPALSLNTFHDGYPLEYGELHVFVRVEPVPFLQLDFGARVAAARRLQFCVFSACDERAALLVGPYLDVRLGWDVFKLGPRVALAADSGSGEIGVVFYPFFFRVL